MGLGDIADEVPVHVDVDDAPLDGFPVERGLGPGDGHRIIHFRTQILGRESLDQTGRNGREDVTPVEGAGNLFEKEGFKLLASSNHSDLLTELARKAKGRARFFKEVGGDEDTMSKLAEAIRIIDLIEKQIESGNIGYEMFIFQSS